VAIDAFVIRTVLVPALMHVFGDANWWLPGWLDRILPHVSVDPADEPLPQDTQKEPPAAELVSR
jgi:RND superfamily putative drug exporter